MSDSGNPDPFDRPAAAQHLPRMDEPVTTVWPVAAVNGGVLLVRFGEVFTVLSGDVQGVSFDEQWFARLTPGRPVEMTVDQLMDLRGVLDRVIAEAGGDGGPCSSC